MSEFKYACPVCGQHIKCDSSQAGTVMTCPTCFQEITVPNAPATEEQKFIITGTKVGAERPLPKLPEVPPTAVPAAPGLSGALVVVIILAFIGTVVAVIYYETIYKAERKRHAQMQAPPQVAPPAPMMNVPTNPPVPLPEDIGNLALHRVAFASSEQTKDPAANGNDGNIHSRWGAAKKTVPQWWTVDLLNSDTVTNVQILWEHEAAYQYVIETSPDDSKWTVLSDRSTNATAARMTSDAFLGHGRFLRVVITGLPAQMRASFYEFRAYGSTNGN